MLPGSLAELTTWQYFSAAPSTASQCAPHWQPLSACILVRLCTQLQHIYAYDTTELDVQEISWHVLRGVSLSSVLGRISVELLVQQVSVPPIGSLSLTASL